MTGRHLSFLLQVIMTHSLRIELGQQLGLLGELWHCR
jgi:hypothetical protein